MSDLFSRAWAKVEGGFQALASEVDAVKAKLETVPGVKQMEDAVGSAIKQQLSNAVAFADTEIAERAPDVISMTESAVDTWVMAVTHGVATPAVPGLNAMMTLGEEQLVAVIRQGFAEARVKLNLPPATSAAAPTASGTVAAVVAALPQSAAA